MLVTHHHLDHAGLAATIARRSGATVAALEPRRRLRRALRAARRGRPPVLARADAPPRRARSRSSPTTRASGTSSATTRSRSPPTCGSRDGETIRAGGRDLRRRRAARATARPTRCFVDDRGRARLRRRPPAGRRSRRTPRSTRPPSRRARARARGWSTSPACGAPRAMPLERLLTGHGEPVLAHARARRRALRRARAPLRADRRRARSRARDRLRDRPAAVAAAHGRRAAAARRLGGARAPRPAARRRRRARGVTRRRRALRAQPRGMRRAPAARRETAPRTGSPRRWPPCTSQLTPSPRRSGRARPVRPDRPRGASSPAAPAGSGSPWRAAFAPGRRRGRRREPQGRTPAREVAAALRDAGWRATAPPACHVGHWEELERARRGRSTATSAASTCSSTTPASRPMYGRLTDVTEELFDKVIARQPQGAVPARRADRRADGGRRRRLDHQRLEHRRRAADERHRPLRRGQGRA